MKITVISYSLTGNNEALANSIAKEFAADHIRIKEIKSRTMVSIMIDLIFNRTPKIKPMPERLDDYDLIILFGPIWIGQLATPLRVYLNYLKTNHCRYAFISLSGGADSTNPKIADELKKRVGREPISLIDLHVSDLLPSDPKPTRKDTSAYRINEEDTKKLTNIVMKTLKDLIQIKLW
jgi:flavodoxin